MIYLFGSIILVSYLILSLKVLERLGLNTFQAIVFNYITCTITGSIVGGSTPFDSNNVTANWFPWACGLGCIFIITLNIAGVTAQRISVAVASVSYRLSLIIPVIFGIYFYNETLSIFQSIGILLALIAVILTCLPNRATEEKNHSSPSLLFALPAILFLGSGLLDTGVKYVEQTYLNDVNRNAFLSAAFAAAATIGLVFLIAQVIHSKQKIGWKNIVAGIIIGVPNYFSIWCLVKFLQVSNWQSSEVIPVNNIAVVLVTTVVAWLAFREVLSKVNWVGIFLSIVAIALIAFGDKI